MHRVAHRGGDKADDFPVALDVIFRFHRRFKALKTAVGAGKDAAMFAPGGGGQQNVRHFGGFGHKDVLHHHEIERVEALTDQAEIGFGLERIFAHDVVGFDFAFERQVRHLGDAHADFVIHHGRIDAPGAREFFPHHRVFDILIAGELVWQHAHIARALHVVLAAHRADADMLAPEITGKQRQA